MVQSKLGKFMQTKLEIVQFGPAVTRTNFMQPQRTRQMVSFDQNNIYRIHRLKGIKLMADKNYLLQGLDPYRVVNLKTASYGQLKSVQVI